LNSSVDKQRRRDEKARQARQAAIEELNQKRERKKDDNKRMAKEELVNTSGEVSHGNWSCYANKPSSKYVKDNTFLKI
jgi:hypothetical protein